MSSTNSQVEAKEITSKDVSLDEVIELPNFDLSNITLEKMQILQEALKRKTSQEQLRKEHKEMQVLYDVEDIFVETFDIVDINEDKPILEQLVHIVEKVNTDDIEANTKTDGLVRKEIPHQGDGENLQCHCSKIG